MRRILILLLAVAGAMSASSASNGGPRYRLIDLGALPGDIDSRALGLNNHGVVVGVSGANFSDSGSRAFIWDRDRGMRPLPALPGGTECSAVAINRSGAAVGWSEVGTGRRRRRHAVRWSSAGEPEDLGTLGGRNSWATDINDSGQVVGASDLGYRGAWGESLQHAFLWQHGRIHDIGATVPLNSEATAINGRGQVVGNVETLLVGVGFLAIGQRAFLWQDGSFATLASPPNESSYAADIDSQGRVLGGQGLRNDPWYKGATLQIWTRGWPRRIAGTDPRHYQLDVHAFNDRGSIAAIAFGIDSSAGDLIEDGQIYWLGARDQRRAWISDAAAINKHGDVAGARYDYEHLFPPPQLAVLLDRRDD
jgi:probable HAF family extracellular repeat protein